MTAQRVQAPLGGREILQGGDGAAEAFWGSLVLSAKRAFPAPVSLFFVYGRAPRLRGNVTGVLEDLVDSALRLELDSDPQR